MCGTNEIRHIMKVDREGTKKRREKERKNMKIWKTRRS
jgi:hypothetical protein